MGLLFCIPMQIALPAAILQVFHSSQSYVDQRVAQEENLCGLFFLLSSPCSIPHHTYWAYFFHSFTSDTFFLFAPPYLILFSKRPKSQDNRKANYHSNCFKRKELGQGIIPCCDLSTATGKLLTHFPYPIYVRLCHYFVLILFPPPHAQRTFPY
jgi:hypothetical protein